MIPIEKVDLSQPRRGRPPHVFPLNVAEHDYVGETTTDKIRYQRKGARFLTKDCILSVHSLYYKKETHHFNVDKFWIYFTDGLNIYRINWYHLFEDGGIEDQGSFFKISAMIRNLVPTYDVISFYSL